MHFHSNWARYICVRVSYFIFRILDLMGVVYQLLSQHCNTRQKSCNLTIYSECANWHVWGMCFK